LARELPEPLFRQYDLRRTLDNQEPEIDKAIEAYPADALARDSEEELVAHFAERFRVDAPVITEGAISVAAEEAQIDVSGDRNRDIWDRSRPFYVPGIEVTYYVPFTGDANLFKFAPSTSDFNPPRADIVGQELHFRYKRAGADVAATKNDFERELGKVRQYLSWISNDVSLYNASLPARIRAKVTDRRGRLEKTRTEMQALGIPLRQAQRPSPSPAAAAASRAGAKQPPAATPTYDVALSFAGENRTYVERVAEILKHASVNVFYDKFEAATLWGKNLVDHLADIYQQQSRFVVMFISKFYVEKAFPTHERQHAQARALVAREEYILPARLDDTECPRLPPTVAYADLRKLSPENLADLILAKLGRKR
jgi:hypothetical protein